MTYTVAGPGELVNVDGDGGVAGLGVLLRGRHDHDRGQW